MTEQAKTRYWGYGYEDDTNEKVFIYGNSPKEIHQKAKDRTYSVVVRKIFRRPEEPTP